MSFTHLLDCITQFNLNIENSENRIKELEHQIQKTQLKIESLIEKTKILKRNIESALSQQYSGRIVNLIGEINNL